MRLFIKDKYGQYLKWYDDKTKTLSLSNDMRCGKRFKSLADAKKFIKDNKLEGFKIIGNIADNNRA